MKCTYCKHNIGWMCEETGENIELNRDYQQCNRFATERVWEIDNKKIEEAKDKEAVKPPLGCSPYYVHISSRICDLCEAIKRYSTYGNKHDKIKLWAYEIMILNEADRNLRHQAKQKVFFEEDMK